MLIVADRYDRIKIYPFLHCPTKHVWFSLLHHVLSLLGKFFWINQHWQLSIYWLEHKLSRKELWNKLEIVKTLFDYLKSLNIMKLSQIVGTLCRIKFKMDKHGFYVLTASNVLYRFRLTLLLVWLWVINIFSLNMSLFYLI